MSGHLTSEQMEAMLAARGTVEAERHVESCAGCAEELAGLRVMFGGLRESATAVALEQRGLARVPAVVAGKAEGFRVPRFAWALAAAAFFVGVSAPVAMHLRPAVEVPVAVAGPAVRVVAISDEALLNSIQDDLSSSVPDSLRPLANASQGTQQGADSNARTN